MSAVPGIQTENEVQFIPRVDSLGEKIYLSCLVAGLEMLFSWPLM